RFEMAAADEVARGGGSDLRDDGLAEILAGPDLVDRGGDAIDGLVAVPCGKLLDGVIDIDVDRAAGNAPHQRNEAASLRAGGVGLDAHGVEQADLWRGGEDFLDAGGARRVGPFESDLAVFGGVVFG